MSIVLDGTSGITTNSGTVVSTTDATLNGLTVGKGGGSVSTNTAVGASALAANTTGANNTGLGNNALLSNTTGNRNSSVGRSALGSVTTASDNSALGYFALQSNSTGASNTAVGVSALQENTTASNNTAVGYQAGYTNSTGPHNTFVGTQAGYSSTGGENTCVGRTAGYSISTGTGNTFVGPGNGATSNGSGYYVTTGSLNTIIGGYNGNQGGLDIRTSSNYIVLSDGAGNPQGYFQPSGNFVVTRSAFSGINCIGCYNDTTGSAANVFITSGGSFVRSTSSLKYKTDVQNASYGLSDVLKLRPVTYKTKSENDAGQTFGGLIAEEVHESGLTEFVQYAEDGTPDALNYGNMVSLAFKAIQELKVLVDAQATEIAELKAKVA